MKSFGNKFFPAVLLLCVLSAAGAIPQKAEGGAELRSAFPSGKGAGEREGPARIIGGIVLGYIWSMIFDGILRRYATYLTANATYGFWV